MKKIITKISLILLIISIFLYSFNKLNTNENNLNIINAYFKNINNISQNKKDNYKIEIKNFEQAKKILENKIYNTNELKIDNYCGCSYNNKKYVNLKSCGYKSPGKSGYKKRANKIEREHIVPAENFGRAFTEWRKGNEKCINSKGKKYKGRECARINKDFNKMESDLYNLIPVIGEVNGLRSNYNYNMVSKGSNTILNFGKCDFKIDLKYKIAEPNNNIKGFVARVIFYMEETYNKYYSISDKQRKILTIWDKNFPVTKDECNITKKKEKYQGNINNIVKNKCLKLKLR